jgi:predicted neuraminidase
VQPSLVRRKDGSVAAYMRDNGPPPQRVLVSDSRDDGRTWSEVRDSDIPNPGSSLEVIGLRSGAWCMVLNDTEKGRQKLSVWLSEDEGKTWPWRRTLEENPLGGFSYPSVIQTKDGQIHATYSHNLKADPEARQLQTIKHVAFREAWLKQGR